MKRHPWFVPLVAFYITVFTIVGGAVAMACSSCVDTCPQSRPAEIVSVELGTVVMDGEVCKVEEVQRIRYVRAGAITKDEVEKRPDLFLMDEEHHCLVAEKCIQPLVRRITCPSGKNAQSIVGHDNTKFHRETLE